MTIGVNSLNSNIGVDNIKSQLSISYKNAQEKLRQNQDDIEDVCELGLINNHGLNSFCWQEQVSSLDEYTSKIKSLIDNSDLSEFDYQSGFQDYLSYRGCDNEQELKILSGTRAITKDQLINVSKMQLQGDLVGLMSNFGISVDSQMHSEVINSADLSQIADYYNGKDNWTSYKNDILNMQSFIGAVSKNQGANSSLLSSYSNSVSANMNLIDALSEKIDKIMEASNPSTMQKKYNESLISNYLK